VITDERTKAAQEAANLSPRPAPPKRKLKWVPLVAGPLVLLLAISGMYVGLKWAYGGYGHYYKVSVTLPRTGEQLTVGSDVRMRGVIVGKVATVELVKRQAKLILKIEDRFRVPSSAEANITLTTLLGAKYVDLRFPTYTGPFMKDGAVIAKGHVGPELEDALDDGVSVLEAINPADLGTIVGELVTGARGHGSDVARALSAQADLSTLFVRTLDPQLASLHDFDVVFGALRHSGADLNLLADAINQGVPVYASKSAQANLDKALKALTPFADNLGDLLILNRADWDRMMNSGDVVLQTIADRPQGLHDLVQGLNRYMFRLSAPPCAGPCGLTDGSGAAGFVNFIGGNTQDEFLRQVCDALPIEVRVLIPLCNGGL
jgi:virulence factor Mce-like protein